MNNKKTDLWECSSHVSIYCRHDSVEKIAFMLLLFLLVVL